MDNLLSLLINHLFDPYNQDNNVILTKCETFKQIVNSKLDSQTKAQQIDKFLNTLKNENSNQRGSYYESQSRQKSFNNSVVLVETKLFEKRFQQRTQEIEEMLKQL